MAGRGALQLGLQALHLLLHVLPEELQQEGLLLQTLHDLRRVLIVGIGRARQHAMAGRAEPSGHGEVQVGHAVQRDGGLARAGASLQHHQPALRAGDEPELDRVDERGDLGQVLVRAQRSARVHAERAPLASGPQRRRARRGALAAGQAGGRHRIGLEPVPAVVGDEGGLRAADPAQPASVDGQAAARLDDTLEGLLAEVLLVVVALLVAIVDAAHRRVAPVDDVHAVAPIDEAALADQHVARAIVLLQPQVGEVG